MSKIIPIAFATDENYAAPTYLVIHTMCKNSKPDTVYDVYILVPKVFGDKYKTYIMSLSEIFSNCKINFIDMRDWFADTKIIIEHTTTPSLYRMLLGDLLPQYDKCIYLDSDIIVCEDLSSLYDYDIVKSGDYIAGVRDIEAEMYAKNFDYEIPVPSFEDYVSTGVLLMNLKQIREDNLTEKFCEMSKHEFFYMDMDIMNAACYPKIMMLPLKYDILVKYKFTNYNIKKYLPEVTKYFSANEIEEARRKPVILHYAQPIKPWSCKYINKGEIWWRWVKDTPDDVQISLIRPFTESKKAGYKTNMMWFTKYVLRKIGIYKYVLVLSKKI